MAKARYLIGIDLGTTHTVVAWTAANAPEPRSIQLFPIEQSVGPGTVDALPLLPSVRYHAAAGELAETDRALPWRSEGSGPDAVIGDWGRNLGAKSRGRLVASAKSWLCHAGVDRTASILPWGAADEIDKISPLDTSSGYLHHVRSAWNHSHPDAPLENQDVVLTVPASFDEAARALTLEAARLAGLKSLRLLEEPQAVCYDWLYENRADLRIRLQGVRLLLVCDVGGGTTDLTLIRVREGKTEPQLDRIAVGNHLILGGDNIDLALAHRAEERLLGPEGKLSAADLSQLVEQCRRAKETLLAADAPDRAVVTLLGSGGRLIGGTRKVELTREEVHALALEGFFPEVELDDLPARRRSAVVEFGLPYVADPAITRHLAAFLGQHREAAREALGNPDAAPVPDGLLLNGGVFRSPVAVARMVAQIRRWSGREPRVLENTRPEYSVAYGAVASALARRERTVQRIGGGSPRSYFLVIETEDSQARRGICILPKGTEEGREIILEERSFLLRLGTPVRFHLASIAADPSYRPSELVDIDADRFVMLPPLAVAFDRQVTGSRPEETVRIAAALTDLGTLDLHCVSIDDPARRWQIEFQLRGSASIPSTDDAPRHPKLDEAIDKIRQAFGKKARLADPKSIKGLRADLERSLGTRADWATSVLRELFGALLDGLPHRRRSAEHERLWFNLTGYCLRPGFGYPLDDWRVEQVFTIYSQGLQFVNDAQNWAEWWTLWRRIAGGLSEERQTALFQDIAEFINPETAKRGNLPSLAKKRSYEDMIRLAATLERLPAAIKTDIGNWLLQRLAKPNEPLESWWALGRVGARVPFHGSQHAVVPASVAETWLDAIMRRDFKKEPQAAFAATLIARLSGDRERDIGQESQARVIDRLRTGRAPDSWVAMVTEVTVLSESDEKRAFGESLPPGLKLLT